MSLKRLGLQDLTIDFKQDNYIQPLRAKEGDVGTRGINLKVLENGAEYDLTGVTGRLIATPRGSTESYKINFKMVDAKSGKMEAVYTTDILKEGIVYVEIRLTESNGNILSHEKMKLYVVGTTVTDSVIEGDNSYPIFEKLLEAGENEIARIDAEQLRASAENDRNSQEGIRQSNESDRKDNEDLRKLNENTRENNESLRNQNEDTRQTNETTRIDNENTRETQEGSRETLFQAQMDRIAEIKKLVPQNISDEISILETNIETYESNVTARVDGIDTRVDDIITTPAGEGITEQEIIDARHGKDSLGTNIQAFKNRFEEHELEFIQGKQPFYYDETLQEYVNIDKFWDSFRDGKIYTVEFNQFDVSPVSDGVKKDDNAGLICEASTNTVRNQNDYEEIGLFMSIDVNAYVDENDDYHVTAIKGDGKFKNDGTMGDVYVMAMPGYQKRFADSEVWGVSYSDTMHPGFEILDEAVKPDGTIRPYLLHAKYVAGRNPHENNNLASISGVPAEYSGMSHNGQITKFKEKGAQYSGKTSHDDYYVNLMLWLKYATLNSRDVMHGASYYYSQYENLVEETDVNKVTITNSQANNLLVGSTVSIGDYGDGEISTSRSSEQNYNLAERVEITEITDLGDGNSEVYVDAPNFSTTLTTTITTYPWNSGGCDDVLGQDGSPYDNKSGKEPCMINGIEMIVGGYEILQNLIIQNDNSDIDNYKIKVHACYDCTKYATSPTADYDLVGHELAQTNNSWQRLSKVGIDPDSPSIIVPIETHASSTTGFGNSVYTNEPVSGYRVWPSLGYLSAGSDVGFRCLRAGSSLAAASWAILGRLSATGRSRRRA